MSDRPVGVAEARRTLSQLLTRVAYRGESIFIAKRGKLVARLVPVSAKHRAPLADVPGWLSDSDPFFAAVRGIVKTRHARRARAARPSGRRRR